MIKFILAFAILYIGWLILTPFPHYLPPDFTIGFLADKKNFFYSSGYFVGFYAHITTAPLGLVIGVVQLSSTVRSKWPRTHQLLGGIYVWLTLVGVAPGGLIMAARSYGGLSSIICFGLISILLWFTTFIAWQRAKQNRYHEHAQWMCRSYVLMCSAILLRVISYGLSGVDLDHAFSYQLSAWLSWVPAMVLLELILLRVNRTA